MRCLVQVNYCKNRVKWVCRHYGKLTNDQRKSGSEKLNRTKTNYLIDLILAMLYLSVVSTGLFMFFFMPSGIQRGGRLVYMGLAKRKWVLIHSRVGILMATLAAIHLSIHWKWIIYNTKNFFWKGTQNRILSKFDDEFFSRGHIQKLLNIIVKFKTFPE
jgi:hypothetical protein